MREYLRSARTLDRTELGVIEVHVDNAITGSDSHSKSALQVLYDERSVLQVAILGA